MFSFKIIRQFLDFFRNGEELDEMRMNDIFSQFEDFTKNIEELQRVKSTSIEVRKIINGMLSELQKMDNKLKCKKETSEFIESTSKFLIFYFIYFQYKLTKFKTTRVTLLKTLIGDNYSEVPQIWKRLSFHNQKKFNVSWRLMEECELDIKNHFEFTVMFNAVYKQKP